jgi:hypothetical protein
MWHAWERRDVQETLWQESLNKEYRKDDVTN